MSDERQTDVPLPPGARLAVRCGMRSPDTLTVTMFLALTLWGVPAAGQDFAGVQNRIKPGDRVSVVDTHGTETGGRVNAVGPSTLRLDVDGTEREWSSPQIWRITRRGDSLRNGILIGSVAGAVAGTTGGLALASLLVNEGHEALGPVLFLVGVGAGGGAGLGAGFDALIRGRTLIYQRTSGVALIPSVGPRTQAVNLTVGF